MRQTSKSKTRLSQNLVKGGNARACACALNPVFRPPVQSAHAKATLRKRRRGRATGTESLQPTKTTACPVIAHVGARPFPCVAGMCLPTWGENKTPFDKILHPWASSVLREDPEKQNSCFSSKPCQVVAHTRARVGKIQFFDYPHNPRMQELFSASGGKVVKLGPTSMRSGSLGSPCTCLKPRNTEIPLLPKSLSRGTARARAC